MKKYDRIFLVLAILIAFTFKVSAQSGIYMKVAGITGDVTAPAAYANTVKLASYQGGAGRPVKLSAGGKGGVDVSAPSIPELTIVLPLGIASLPLLNASLNTTTPISSVDFYFVGESCSCPYYRVHLENVYVTGFSESSGGDKPVNSVSLFFTKIAWAFYAANSTTITNTTGYDLAAGRSFSYSFP